MFQYGFQDRRGSQEEIDIFPSLLFPENHIVGPHEKVVPYVKLFYHRMHGLFINGPVFEFSGDHLEGGPVPDIRIFDRARVGIAFIAEGDQMGYLWKHGFFPEVDPK